MLIYYIHSSTALSERKAGPAAIDTTTGYKNQRTPEKIETE
jgi:hypothetical protein